jgi:pseudouridine synthase
MRRMRLARMIALSSELSRRAAEEAISRGEVTVNGQVVTKLGTVIDPRTVRVCLKGETLSPKTRAGYIAYYKPRKVLVTKSDPLNRPIIWDQLEEWKDRYNSVGRLDYHSEGLLLITDDGDFLNRLTHPRHGIWKTYQVRVKGVPTAEALGKLRHGIWLDQAKTLPARIRRLDEGDENALFEVCIREGKRRQIRRMFEAIYTPVLRLRRVAIGPVKLGRLKAGQWRQLKPNEVDALIRLSEEGDSR